MENYEDELKEQILRDILTIETRIYEEKERLRQETEGPEQNAALSEQHEQIQRVILISLRF
jgi:hypothetical protein